MLFLSIRVRSLIRERSLGLRVLFDGSAGKRGTKILDSPHIRSIDISPSKVFLVCEIIHEDLFQQRVRLFLEINIVKTVVNPSRENPQAAYLQLIMPRLAIKLQPRLLTLPKHKTHQHIPLIKNPQSLIQFNLTLKVTTNPVSQTLSLLTFVKFSGVFNGFPPLGMPKMRS